jgi:catechol 2,3-dioxygenase-like lactoylglutathione lyase family enzyme
MQPSRFPIVLLTIALLGGTATAHAQERPKITGISHMAVYTSNPEAAEHFYREELGAAKQADPETEQGTVYRFNEQFVEVLPLPAQHSSSRLDHVAFATTDVAALHGYLGAHHYNDIDDVTQGSDGSQWFFTRDPEGNRVEFYQAGPLAPSHMANEAISTRIIHVGFLVKDRAAEDHFYRELLGFRPYWYGAMHPGKLDWVSQQVPDGHDWLEYMMTGPGSDTPDANKVDARQLGVLNHFSLGVPNMERAVTALYVNDAIRFSPRHDGPQMGKDGKWQANLYDPDGTRVELMEFQPVMKPCCSDFTAESPAD